MDDCFRREEGTIRLAVKVIPGASKTEFAGLKDGHLRVRVAAAAQDGKANAELAAFLARALGCAKRDVALVRGEKSRHKSIALPLACGIKLEAILEEQRL